MNWQPIETAPRDTDVLVYFEFATVPIVHIARRGSIKRWEESGKYCGGNLENFLSWRSYTRDSVRQEKLEGFCSPQYWMPLPEVRAVLDAVAEGSDRSADDLFDRLQFIIERLATREKNDPSWTHPMGLNRREIYQYHCEAKAIVDALRQKSIST